MIEKTDIVQTLSTAATRDQSEDYFEAETRVMPFQIVELKYWREGLQTPHAHVLHIQGKSIPQLIELLQRVKLFNPEESK